MRHAGGFGGTGASVCEAKHPDPSCEGPFLCKSSGTGIDLCEEEKLGCKSVELAAQVPNQRRPRAESGNKTGSSQDDTGDEGGCSRIATYRR